MDHDASPTTAEDSLVPPARPGVAITTGVIGAGLCALAAIVGAVVSGFESPPWTATARLLLVVTGAVIAGAAVSLTPGRWPVWALGVAAAVAARFGIPDHWDSFRMLAGVLAA